MSEEFWSTANAPRKEINNNVRMGVMENLTALLHCVEPRSLTGAHLMNTKE